MADALWRGQGISIETLLAERNAMWWLLHKSFWPTACACQTINYHALLRESPGPLADNGVTLH